MWSDLCWRNILTDRHINSWPWREPSSKAQLTFTTATEMQKQDLTGWLKQVYFHFYINQCQKKTTHSLTHTEKDNTAFYAGNLLVGLYRRETFFQYSETTSVIYELLACTGKPQDSAIHYTNLQDEEGLGMLSRKQYNPADLVCIQENTLHHSATLHFLRFSYQSDCFNKNTWKYLGWGGGSWQNSWNMDPIQSLSCWVPDVQNSQGTQQ